MILKTIDGHSFAEPQTYRIKVSSRGLIGSDRRSLLKRASIDFVDAAEKLASEEAGLVPVHVIALGCTEAYGPNRNGDGFREEVCKKYHNTFTKYARAYREHANRDPSKSYGVIKKSAYNPSMKRIELLVGYFATKEAAEKYGGKIADKELEILEKGGSLPVSMSCIVSHDICSGCGNKASTRAEYCGPELCKYDGLKYNMGRVFEDGHILHADNPDPKFIDLSYVAKNADRIAYTIGSLTKTASVNPEITNLSGLFVSKDKTLKQKLLIDKLAELEKSAYDYTIFDNAFAGIIRESEIFTEYPKPLQALNYLAKQGSLMPLKAFLDILAGKNTGDKYKKVASALPGIFSSLKVDDGLDFKLSRNSYLADYVPTTDIIKWATQFAGKWNIDESGLIKRAQLNLIRHPDFVIPKNFKLEKTASTAAEELAKEYALYELAVLCNIDNQDMAAKAITRYNLIVGV